MNKILKEVPEDWRELKDAITAPKGYNWYWNGKSFFSNECEIGLVKIETNEKEK